MTIPELRELERQIVEDAHRETGGSLRAMARVLDVGVSSVQSLCRKYGLAPGRVRGRPRTSPPSRSAAHRTKDARRES
jgi:transposase